MKTWKRINQTAALSHFCRINSIQLFKCRFLNQFLSKIKSRSFIKSCHCLLQKEAAAFPVRENQWEQRTYEIITYFTPMHGDDSDPVLMKVPCKWKCKKIKCISSSSADGASWFPLPAHRFGFWPRAEDPGHRLQIRRHTNVSFHPFTLSVVWKFIIFTQQKQGVFQCPLL